eukprot:jgi/Botrbrau1/13913/Bobra.136_2s0006.1
MIPAKYTTTFIVQCHEPCAPRLRYKSQCVPKHAMRPKGRCQHEGLEGQQVPDQAEDRRRNKSTALEQDCFLRHTPNANYYIVTYICCSYNT